jgi:hypothetical protein
MLQSNYLMVVDLRQEKHSRPPARDFQRNDAFANDVAGCSFKRSRPSIAFWLSFGALFDPLSAPKLDPGKYMRSSWIVDKNASRVGQRWKPMRVKVRRLFTVRW